MDHMLELFVFGSMSVTVVMVGVIFGLVVVKALKEVL